MSIIDISFFVFVAITLAVYYVLPLKYRWIALTAASVYFYVASCGPALFAVMLASLLLVYGAGLFVDKQNRLIAMGGARAGKAGVLRSAVLIGAIVLLSVVLVLYKEIDGFLFSFQLLANDLGAGLSIAPFAWAAPLGISYYTLILIGYLLDVAWGTSAPQRNPLKLLLFGAYFPIMTSGPFLRYDETGAALYAGHRFDYTHFCFGIQRMLWGLFKKLVIAERLSVLVAAIYARPDIYPGVYILIAFISYTLQVYADFSGCMDLILGVSEMFGVILPENFDTPFYATSLSELWRRWHITLGLWLKSYILYPVLKSRLFQAIGSACRGKWGKKWGKDIPTYLGMLVSWLFIGFWHGGTAKFVFGSGLFFFFMIAGGMLLSPFFQWLIRVLRINTEAFSWKLFQRIRTFLLFTFSVSFGRLPGGIRGGLHMWKLMLSAYNPWVLLDNVSLYTLGLDEKDFWCCVYALGVFFLVSKLQQTGSVREKLARQNLAFRWAILLALLMSVIILGLYGPDFNPASFVYAGF